MNSIFHLKVYRSGGLWVFDDPARGLEQEPFVAGMDEMIDRMVERIPYAALGFALIFSLNPFPGYQVALERKESDMGGTWYWAETLGMKGWLCPALFKFFPIAPQSIYVQCKAINHAV